MYLGQNQWKAFNESVIRPLNHIQTAESAIALKMHESPGIPQSPAASLQHLSDKTTEYNASASQCLKTAVSIRLLPSSAAAEIVSTRDY